jgi:hypothetical protein
MLCTVLHQLTRNNSELGMASSGTYLVVISDEEVGVDHLVEEGLHQVLPRSQLQQRNGNPCQYKRPYFVYLRANVLPTHR